ncbi:MAG TPA: copper homeostasis periplasmic binding protein CopC [Phenylobacterium sp.]|uniref:copper homeostasis periplasmic binding protein CopC n=1 Tax=Phenylobacterium sp. TaxID=1871053 RepID=UPI002B45E6C5|nr:copper homeostasis periplasmic binding protein CopC [Phenylobacterium sp.]HKR88004.1 copper homeostasis periplasmic binding protein CopC [Phenylobacterium sp.]
MKLNLIAAATALALTGLATQASAHAHLLSSSPAANATVAAPGQLTLKFSEKLQPKFSGLAITMPQMNNIAAPTKVAVSKDGRSLVATPTTPLSAGVYKVSWHAVTADTHRVQGAYSFTVR